MRSRTRPSSSRPRGPFAPEIERLAAAGGGSARGPGRAWPGRSPRSRSTAPTSSRSGGGHRRRSRGGARGLRAGRRSASSLAQPGGARPSSYPQSWRRCCCWSATPARQFVTRFQQTTPPVVAKGVEDTAFYRYARLLALSTSAATPAASASASSASMPPTPSGRAASRRRMLTTMTHDTKRSADVRARIAALTWMPELWAEHASGAGCRVTEPLRAGGAPDDVERYFIFQTLAGAWPIEAERVQAVHGEGAARGQAQHATGSTRTPRGRTRSRGSAAELYAHGEFHASLDEFVRELEFAGRPDRARHGGAQADLARGRRTSTRAMRCRCARSSTRTTGARSTGTGTRRCWDAWGGGCAAGAGRRASCG